MNVFRPGSCFFILFFTIVMSFGETAHLFIVKHHSLHKYLNISHKTKEEQDIILSSLLVRVNIKISQLLQMFANLYPNSFDSSSSDRVKTKRLIHICFCQENYLKNPISIERRCFKPLQIPPIKTFNPLSLTSLTL